MQEKENQISIFLFSESSRKCVELKTSVITPSDLVSLQRILPRNLKGVSFHRPTLNLEEDENSDFAFHAETRDPYVSKYLAQVGKSLLSLGEPLGALRFFDFSLKVENNPNLNFQLLRSKALMEVGQIDEAATIIDQLVKENPENGFAQFLLAKIFFYQNNYLSSVNYFEKAKLFLSKEDPYHYFSEVHILINQLFLERDSLYAKNLTVTDLIQEIEILKEKVVQLKSNIHLKPKIDRKIT